MHDYNKDSSNIGTNSISSNKDSIPVKPILEQQTMYNNAIEMEYNFFTTPFNRVSQQSKLTQIQAQSQETVETKEDICKIEKSNDPLISIIPDNPWNSFEVTQELDRLKQNKIRLNISTDNQLLSHVREFIKDENASFDHIASHNLKDFNNYLDKKVV
ncbi:hypothetical protein PDN53_22685 [Bacillus cereus]|nr:MULTISPECIES: hypothetical protein [Bacillus cereus group]MDA2417065.1 hypothetical protein [Bacillus cereus]MDR4363631.1 hypothetical protein [Bacillus cereus]HDR4860994.1 hypothetical protein [Bacillus cereus]